MNEELKIKDYPYYISNMGNVKNKTGRKLKPKITNKGYLPVALYNANGKRWCYIHRLVAMHFLFNSELKPNVNHIDCNPLNNNVDNLEWCTQSRCKIRDKCLKGERKTAKGYSFRRA